jgi:Zn-dependent peptidase ImmA (M78 family)/transcriptional regulator with XRE-family HTH domain
MWDQTPPAAVRQRSTLRSNAVLDVVKSINPSRIKLARGRRGYTKSQLAKLLGVSIQTVMMYEKGTCSPAQDTLAGLQRSLGFPAEFFYGDDIEQPNPDAVSFRALKSMTARLRDMAIGQGSIAMLFAHWLEQKFELPNPCIPDLSRESTTPEVAAEMLRREWGIGVLSVRNMVHLLEANGVRVFSLSIEAKQVDAFSFWNGSIPFIMLNSFKSAEHSRFDAAHELGHLVLHKHAGPQGLKTEEQANRFASAFLMPDSSIRACAPRFPTVESLIALKSSWGVSVAALAYRLHAVGLLSDWHYRGLCIEMSKRGYRSDEPNECPRESSAVLPKLLAHLYTNERVTRRAIAQQINVPLSEIEGLLFGLAMSRIEGANSKGSSGPKAELIRLK